MKSTDFVHATRILEEYSPQGMNVDMRQGMTNLEMTQVWLNLTAESFTRATEGEGDESVEKRAEAPVNGKS